jgi:SulP family sulfate permease
LYAVYNGLSNGHLGGRPEWYLVEQGNSDCFNCFDEVKRLEYVFAAVALAGVIQILIGLFKLGKFIRLVPQPVMFGFVNGLAIIIFYVSAGAVQNSRKWECLVIR